MNNLKHFILDTQTLDDADKIDQQLIEGLNTFINNDATRKSHFFDGRYENIYIDADKIPALSFVLTAAKKLSADILNTNAANLKAGLWFNVMNPGDKTTLHRHDDYDELLSAVYYIKVANNSGLLQLEKKNITIQVKPEQGMFVFFPPYIPHKVTENLSNECRISLGINIGPIADESDL